MTDEPPLTDASMHLLRGIEVPHGGITSIAPSVVELRAIEVQAIRRERERQRTEWREYLEMTEQIGVYPSVGAALLKIAALLSDDCDEPMGHHVLPHTAWCRFAEPSLAEADAERRFANQKMNPDPVSALAKTPPPPLVTDFDFAVGGNPPEIDAPSEPKEQSLAQFVHEDIHPPKEDKS